MAYEDEDINLVNDFKNGETEAFYKLVKKYKNKIFNNLYRLTGNREDAEDLTQEVFIKIFNSIRQYNTNNKFSTWIYRIMINTFIDFFRKEKNKNTLLIDDSYDITNNFVLQDNQKTFEDEIENNEKKEKVINAIKSLPENQRIAIILKVYDNMSYEDISRIMKISIKKVENLLYRARNNLKNKLKNIIE